MKRKQFSWSTFWKVGLVLTLACLVGVSAAQSQDNETSRYLEAVREFADNVLKYGRDVYCEKHTPLFVDGLNIHTHQPVKWISVNDNVSYDSLGERHEA